MTSTLSRIPLAAKSVRPGMTILAYNSETPQTVRKATPMKDGKRVRFFWKNDKFSYWDVNLQTVVGVVTKDGRVSLDREITGVKPEDITVEETPGAVTAKWMPNTTQDADRPVINIHDACRTKELDLERQVNSADEELHTLGLEYSKLTQKLEHEEAYSSSLERLVLSKFTKEELLGMVLGRQSD